MSDYSSHDALGLAELIRMREVSPRELVTAAIERIEQHDPALNAVVYRTFETARRVAEAPLPEGPFRGVPFLLKDLLAWCAGEPITSGSRLFRGWNAPCDSEIVRRYRQAGLVIVGKTNTPEFGLVPFTESELHGPCRNPWNTAMTPGGSSGGSAAAVACGMVPMAGGGDGGGSIRIPASCCGVFGLKPTRGRNPTGPIQGEIWQGAVVEHVLTRSVRDSAAMLDALSGPEPGSPYYAPAPPRPFLESAQMDPPRLRIAFSTAPMLGRTVHPDCVRAVEDAARLLESLGHEVVEAAPAVDRESFARDFVVMICGETRADLDDATRILGRAVARGDVETTTWALALLGQSIPAAEFSGAVRSLQRAARRMGAFFEEHPILVTPVLAAPPFPIGALQPPRSELLALEIMGRLRAGRALRAFGAIEQTADKVFEWMSFTPLANVTGQPAMSLPLHWTADGLPVGVQFTGRYGDESTLLMLAAQLEQAAPWHDRHPPIWS
ncbi:MAG TPA: amidase [Gemmatimonadaceae bacterium]|nr:amidase [Gemmatimonadaceae bacterium]